MARLLLLCSRNDRMNIQQSDGLLIFYHKPVVILIFYLNIFLSGGWGVGGVGWGLFHEKNPHNISGYTLMDQHILSKYML